MRPGRSAPVGGDDVDLTSRVGGVTLPNPVMTASGTAGYGIELAPYLDLASLGAVVVKSLSAAPWAGNPAPRVHQSGAGMLNSVGLQNPGVDPWLAEELPALAAARARVVVSVWGFSTAAYEQVGATIARAVAGGASGSGGGASGTGGGAGRSGAGVSGAPGAAIVAVEANISCPNVEDRSNVFAHSCAGTQAAVQATARGLDGALPLWVKLSPNVTDLPAIAGAALGAGASALVLTNTLMGMALDPATGRSRLGAGGGGLSGPALHPVAVRAVYDCRAAHPTAPIVGVGGVATGEDAAELLAAGADAVQVGTASFADPRAPARVLSELAGWCRRHGVSSLADLVGRAHRATC